MEIARLYEKLNFGFFTYEVRIATKANQDWPGHAKPLGEAGIWYGTADAHRKISLDELRSLESQAQATITGVCPEYLAKRYGFEL